MVSTENHYLYLSKNVTPFMAGNSAKMIDIGLQASETNIYDQDTIWSRHSNDKVDIGQRLVRVIRTLFKTLPVTKSLRALSVGSGIEPQFKILEPVFRGGLYLLDIDKKTLKIVDERIQRQEIKNVSTILEDYNRVFLNSTNTDHFLETRMDGKRLNLIAFHHSLYYTEEKNWHEIFQNVYRHLLARSGAIHSVMMDSTSKSPDTTTWLYNHFAGKFFDQQNDQNLAAFTNELKKDSFYRQAQILSKRSYISFFVDNFRMFMAVIWMILLYPEVHKYTLSQREEITEYIYKNFWLRKTPLIQEQTHMVIYRGIGFKGIL